MFNDITQRFGGNKPAYSELAQASDFELSDDDDLVASPKERLLSDVEGGSDVFTTHHPMVHPPARSCGAIGTVHRWNCSSGDEESNCSSCYTSSGRINDLIYALTTTFYSTPGKFIARMRHARMSHLLGTDISNSTVALRWLWYWLTIGNLLRILILIATMEVFTSLPSITAIALFHLLVWVVPILSLQVILVIASIIALTTSRNARAVIYWVLTNIFNDPREVQSLSKGLVKKLRGVVSADQPSWSHPTLSKDRNDGMERAFKICEHIGCVPYMLLMTRRQLEIKYQRGGIYGAPTLNLAHLDVINNPYAYNIPADIVPESAAIVMIDRDYYVDMNDVFMLGMPVILYTFDPNIPCYRDKEFEFTFNPAGKLVGNAQGSIPWEHELWHYPDDMLTVSRDGVMYTYKVLKYRCSFHHSLIWFQPVGSVLSLTTVELTRWSPVVGSALVMTDRSDTMVACAGEHQFTKLSSVAWEALVSNIRAKSMITNLPSVTTADTKMILYQHDIDNELTETRVWAALKALDVTKFSVTLSHAPSDFSLTRRNLVLPTSYTAIGPDGECERDSIRSGLKTITAPVIEAGAVPIESVENTRGGILKRILDPQEEADRKTANISDEYFEYVEEFACLFTQGVTLYPLSEEEVAQRMSRPEQCADREVAAGTSLNLPSQAVQFQKAEAYTNPNDSRNIVTEKGPFKDAFAAYTYPLADHMKTFPWYAFGKSCAQVAERVAQICKLIQDDLSLSGIETDYSRFDGTVNAFLRYLCEKVYEHAYPHNKHIISDLLETRKERWIRADFNVWYNSGNSQMSGDNNTSIIGSMGNAFVAYCTYRKEGLTPDEAWKSLGIYGGDDGVSAVRDVDLYKQVAQDLGLDLEATLILPPRTGNVCYPTFLARVYGPKVWYGELDSCCDIKRTLAKLHISDLSAVPSQRLWEKCYAMLISDSNTPILRVYAKAVCTVATQIYKGQAPLIASSHEEFRRKYNRTVSWWLVAGIVEQASKPNPGFPNANYDDWMCTYVNKVLPDLDIFAVESTYKEVGEKCVAMAQEQDTGSGRKKKAALATCLSPFSELPPLCSEPLKLKPGAKMLITTSDDQFILSGPPGPSRVPPKDKILKPDIRPGMAAAYHDKREVEQGLRAPPYPDMPVGARKCMFVAHRFVNNILSKFTAAERSGCQIIYTGAASQYTAVPIAKLFYLNFPMAFRFIFIDPALHEDAPWTKELRTIPKVSVRTVRMNAKLFEEVISKSTDSKGKQNKIFWLDDAFATDTGSVDGDNDMFNAKKAAIYNQFCKQLSYSTLKFKLTSKSHLYNTASTSISIYKTPVNTALFSNVVERRMEIGPHVEGSCDVDWNTEVAQTDTSEAIRIMRIGEQQIASFSPDLYVKPREKKTRTDTVDSGKPEEPIVSEEVPAAVSSVPPRRGSSKRDNPQGSRKGRGKGKKAKVLKGSRPPTDEQDPEDKP